MSDNSAIEWTGATWNPVTGCTKVSPGCAHCYIERQTPMRVAGRKFVRGTLDVRLHPERLDARKVAKLRPLDRPIFVCSMSDLFHEDVPWEHIFQVFLVMQETPQRTFQVLTKRPERMRDLVLEFRSYHGALDNVWLGVTVENDRHAFRADVLRKTRAAVRFISAEPLLGPLPSLDLTGIDWVICGGESGPGARPMHADWAREIRDACLDNCLLCRILVLHGAGDIFDTCPEFDHRPYRPAFFFKQWGGRTPKSGGRLLDGRTWNEMPAATPKSGADEK